MAGLGDKRVDATNHEDDSPWVETDCYEWSRVFFTNHLCDKKIVAGEGNLHITTKKNLDLLDGEAYVTVNAGEGQINPRYQLALVLSFEAEARDDDGVRVLLKTEGSVMVPTITDEGISEEDELGVMIGDDGSIGKRLRQAFLEKGRAYVLEKVRAYAQAMDDGDVESKKVDPAAGSVVDLRRKRGHTLLMMSEGFSCRAKDLYEIFLDEDKWKGFTRSNAMVSKEVGGCFSVLDGAVTGQNVQLVKGKSIMQLWRLESWPVGVESMVCLGFRELVSGLSMVKLTHVYLPKEDRYGNAKVVEDTERIWKDLIFNKMKKAFGL